MLPFVPKLVLFDFDGTLVEFHHEYLFSQTEKILSLLEHPPVSRSVLDQAFRAFDFFRFVGVGDRESFIESFWREFDWDSFPQPKPFSGVEQMFVDLRARGISSAIVTARCVEAERLRQEIAHTGILEHVVDVHTRAGEHVHWTDKRETIEKACREFGISPAEALMVGDIPTDITSAREVGIGRAVAVESGGILTPILSKSAPDAILPDVTHLVDWIFS